MDMARKIINTNPIGPNPRAIALPRWYYDPRVKLGCWGMNDRGGSAVRTGVQRFDLLDPVLFLSYRYIDRWIMVGVTAWPDRRPRIRCHCQPATAPSRIHRADDVDFRVGRYLIACQDPSSTRSTGKPPSSGGSCGGSLDH
eukprot:1392918-Amorphochlora_amoeboformis.AAC.1